MPKNNDAWDFIFDKLSILSSVDRLGFFDVSADDIKKYGNREPRLMTKIDYEEILPEIMKNNGLSILAISNGLYRIARTNPFMKISPLSVNNPEIIIPSKGIVTIDPFSIKTESQILDVCSVNGILDKVFGEESSLTIRGRVRIDNEINFSLANIKYRVSGVQVEVDGGYEGAKSINLVEAKIGGRDNLSIRQLVYPELFWKARPHKKNVKSYVLLYEKNTIRFIPFQIIEDGKYILDNGNERQFQFLIFMDDEFDIANIKTDPTILNTNAPFPQANDFDKVVAMFNYISSGYTSKDELSNEFDIVERQIFYYYAVLDWLGICEYKDDLIILTERGQKLSKLSKLDLIKELAKLVFSSKIFHDVLRYGKENVDEKDFVIWGISGTTVPRRLQTVEAWIRYFKENT